MKQFIYGFTFAVVAMLLWVFFTRDNSLGEEILVGMLAVVFLYLGMTLAESYNK